jgi:ribosomal protein S27AE
MFGWTHYRVDMLRAQRRADRANCPQCGAYGAFEVRAHGQSPADEDEADDDETGGWIRVACRRCGEQWNI